MSTRQRRGIRYCMGEAKSGVPLGGIGTGSIELDTTGALMRSTLQNNWTNEIEILPGTFFALYTKQWQKKICKILQSNLSIRKIQSF